MRFSRKSNKPFNAGASTLYFLYCYIFTGMLFCVFWGASFLFADALTTGANACGPYMSAAAAAFDTLKTEASADADVFKVLFDFFLEPRYGTRLGRGASHARSPTALTFRSSSLLRYAGLWLCVKSKNLALWRRVFLGAHVASWALCPLLNIINWMNILLVFSRPLHFRVFISVLYAIPCFGYTLGFCYCFSPSNLTHGVAEWLMLLLMQVLLIPLYAAFEAYGIVLALIAPWKKFAPMLKKFATEWFGGKKKRPSAQGETAFTGFKLVQKQGKDAAKRAAEMEAAGMGVEETEVEGTAAGREEASSRRASSSSRAILPPLAVGRLRPIQRGEIDDGEKGSLQRLQVH